MSEQPLKTVKLAPTGLPGRRGKFSNEKASNSCMVIWRLWAYLVPAKWQLLLVLILLLVNTFCSLGGAYLLRPTINNFIITHNVSGLSKMAFLLIIIYTMGFAAGLLQNRLMIGVAQQTVGAMRTDLFSKMQTLPLHFFDTNNHGDLMSRFTNDIDNVSDALNTSILQLFTSTITVAGILLLMVWISPQLTTVTLLMVPLMLWVAAKIIQKSKNYFSSQQSALGAVNGYLEEMIAGQKVVKVLCHETAASAAFKKINEDLCYKATQAQLYSGVMMPVIQNLNTINFALTATVGGLLAILRGLDIGGLAAFLQYSRQFGRPVNEISNQYNSLQSALAGAERIFQIMDELPETPDAATAITLQNVKGDVLFDAVAFGYDEGKLVLRNISFSAKAGQKIALVGATGAGKTTIMNLLPRFYDIQSGSITVDGTNIQQIQRNCLRQSLAIVLQDTHLFTASVMENIRYGKLTATDEEVIAASELAGAHSFILLLPDAYNTVLENDGGNLSQGQRQLLNIARAAVAKPPILILDEATSSVDTRTEQIIQRGIDNLMQGRTSFVIAHRLATVRNADEILVMENGEIIERGNHAALLQLNGKYHALYYGQFD